MFKLTQIESRVAIDATHAPAVPSKPQVRKTDTLVQWPTNTIRHTKRELRKQHD